MTDSFAPLLRSLWTDLQDHSILWQVAAIIVSVALAAWFSFLVRPRLRGVGSTRLEFGLGSLRRLVLPLSALVLVLTGRWALLHFQPNVSLLNIAVPLLTAMATVCFPTPASSPAPRGSATGCTGPTTHKARVRWGLVSVA